MKKGLKILSIMALFGTLVGVTACGETPSSDPQTSISSSHEVKDIYEVKFDFNYEGSKPKIVKVKNGKTTSSFAAKRTGYTLLGWYTDPECSDENKFNFTATPITYDIILYAKWEKDPEKFKVTLDFNYTGADDAAEISVEDGSYIKDSQIPSCPRLGFEFEGWYLDKDCKNKFDISTTKVTSSMTLYAKYKYDDSIPRNGDGSIRFENVTLSVWSGLGKEDGAWGNANSMIKNAITKFNQQYAGQIKVTLDYNLSQDDHCVRIQQTPGVNSTIGTYYTASDVLDFAGVSFDATEWYTNAIKENYVQGKLKTIPLMGAVPMLAYNKTLMAKYNSGSLPTNYTEFLNVLKAAHAGESATNDNFTSITSSGGWTFKEATSQATFMQNDAEYYSYKDGKYVNEWGTDNANAKTALTHYYELFATGGQAHGKITNNDDWSNDLAAVRNGNALFQVINMSGGGTISTIDGISGIDNSIGFMPLSGLFADSDKENKDAIPYHQISLEFYKNAKNTSMIQLAAGGVFADFLTDNLVDLSNDINVGRCGLYPLKKAVAQKALTDSTQKVQRMLSNAGNPQNFTTLDGYSAQKSIINQTVAETYLVEVNNWTSLNMLDSFVSTLKAAITTIL